MLMAALPCMLGKPKVVLPLPPKLVPRMANSAEFCEIDLEVAHQPFDHFGAKFVLTGQPIAFGCCENAGSDLLGIASKGDMILNVATRQPSDC